MKSLEQINDLDRKNRDLSDEKHYEEDLEKYKLLEMSYKEAVIKINNNANFTELKGISEVYSKIADYWKEQAMVFKEGKISKYVIEGDSLQMQAKENMKRL